MNPCHPALLADAFRGFLGLNISGAWRSAGTYSTLSGVPEETVAMKSGR
jgi:hypothetical protein